MEEWKDVVGYEEYFKVSNLGRIYSKRTNKILKQTKIKTGYMTFVTRFNGRSGNCKCFKVHRLVADAFVENPCNKSQVNHIDGNKINNCVSNLEWCTQSENTQHAVDTGLMIHAKGEDSPISKLTEGQIKYIREVYTPFCKLYGARALAKKFGVVHSRISEIANHKSWKHVE